jgi:excisionase family DNA binding protein
VHDLLAPEARRDRGGVCEQGSPSLLAREYAVSMLKKLGISEQRQPMDIQTSAWLTVNEAAQYLSIKPRTLAQWARQGTIKGYVLSGTRRHVWRFLRSDLDGKLTAPTVALSKGRIQ